MWFTEKLNKFSAKKDTGAFIATWLPKNIYKKFKHIDGLNNDLHVSFLSITKGINTNTKKEQIKDAVSQVCARNKPMKSSFQEVGVMGNEKNTLVANVNIDDGAKFYSDLVETIEKMIGEKIQIDYDFLPHVTLKSESDGNVNVNDLRKYKWTIDKIIVQFGGPDGEKHEFKIEENNV